MRVPSQGGASQELFLGKTWSVITCPLFPPARCVIAEPTDDGKQEIITEVDPLHGRGPELAHFELDPNQENWDTAISPDGSRIAATRDPYGPIYLISLRGEPTREIRVHDWTNILGVNWSADGKGLLVASAVREGRVLLYVDLEGNAHPLWRAYGATGETVAYPSPDGQHLALSSWTTSGNMWILEKF